MATASRTEDPGLNPSLLEETLRDDACSFEFFQAVTLLQRLRRGSQPVGRFSNPEDEAVHFSVNNELAFPASQVQEISYGEDRPAQMKVNFMGLSGPMGVLPYCYSELVLERLRAKDKSLQSFLDIFNHRIISFFYRAWEKYRFPVTYYLGDEDLFTHHLLDLIGLGTPGLQERQVVPDDAFLHYVALLGEQSRSPSALEAILRDYFQVPVEIEQFIGAWYRLDPSARCCMQEDNDDSEQLGRGAIVGDEIWDQRSRVRIKLGPMTLPQYRDFLPDGSALEPLRAITRFFSNNEFDFEVQLFLRQEEVPSCEVGFEGEGPPRLGWVTWLKSKPLNRNPGDTILRL
jgi:type VI secretion system protein ImpH